MIKKESFGEYEKYIIESEELRLEAISLGARVASLRFRGRETVLCYGSAAEYEADGAYICALIGRYANRIGGAGFSLNGRDYSLAANEGENQLHGGPTAFDKRPWQAEELEKGLRFSMFSADGDNGFPGNLWAWVEYRLQGSRLRMDFYGRSDGDTVFSPTSHMYFNLDGSEDVRKAELMINASRYLEVDGGLIPTGRLLSAEGDFDFRRMKRIDRDFDSCFVLDGEAACTMRAGGLSMSLRTDMPAMQLYTSSGLGAPFGRNRGLAIEPQFYPDSPNHPNFPSTLLKKGELFHRYAEFCFAM